MTTRFEKMLASIKAAHPELTEEQARLQAQDRCDEEDEEREEAEYEAACFAAQDPAAHHARDDTPSLRSADLYGTGEGRFHGVI